MSLLNPIESNGTIIEEEEDDDDHEDKVEVDDHVSFAKTTSSNDILLDWSSLDDQPQSSPTGKIMKKGEERGGQNMDIRLNRAIRIFNLNWKRGIAYVLDVGLVLSLPGDKEGDARRLASFLFHVSGLNREQIGKVLGDAENCLVLTNFLDLFDFSNYGPTVSGLETAMRELFRHFKPPGEAQQISRILDYFSQKFNQDTNMSRERSENPPDFDPSATQLLAFSILMLNSDLHNPNNTTRMTKSAYIKNLRGTNNNADFPEKGLSEIYDSISSNEIRHHVDRNEMTGNLFTNPDKAGVLFKKGAAKFSSWKPRWFILSENALYYFKSDDDVDPRGFFPLENVLVRTCFEEKHSNPELPFVSGSFSGHMFSGTSSIISASSSESTSSLPTFSKSQSDRLKRSQSTTPSSFRGKYWFELYSWHPHLPIKSARLKKNGALVLAQYHSVKLRADSLSEMEDWVELIREKSKTSAQMQELALAAHVQKKASRPMSFRLSKSSSILKE